MTFSPINFDEIILTTEKAKAAGIAVEAVKPGKFYQILQTSGQILALDCTMVMGETVEFLRQLLVGRNLFSEMDDIVCLLERRFLALSQKAMIAALYDAQNRVRMAYPEVFRKIN